MATVRASRKRKERDEPAPAAGPISDLAGNRLLAGYLAHEFLTLGTLMGRRPEVEAGLAQARARSEVAFADVAVILKAGGIHIPGVVNPTELGRWLKL